MTGKYYGRGEGYNDLFVIVGVDSVSIRCICVFNYLGIILLLFSMVMLSLWVGVVNVCKIEVPLDIMLCLLFVSCIRCGSGYFCVIAEGCSLELGHYRVHVVR